MKGTIDLLAVAENENDKAEKDVKFQNDAPCISKITSTLIDNADDLDIVKNKVKYSQNY